MNEEAPAAEDTAPAPLVEAEPTAPAIPAPAAPPSGASRRVAVPMWVLLLVGGLAIAGSFFALGWIAAPGGGGSSRGDVVLRRGTEGVPGFGPNGDRGRPGFGPGAPPAARWGVAFLGVATRDATDPRGARVVQVASGSPADRAGLRAGDVITKVDDATVDSAGQLTERVRVHRRGDRVAITYTRDGRSATATVQLVSRTVVTPRAPMPPNPGQSF